MEGGRQYDFFESGTGAPMKHRLRRALVRPVILRGFFEPGTQGGATLQKAFVFLGVFVSLWFNMQAQSTRTDISLNSGWHTRATDSLQDGIAAFQQPRWDNTNTWKTVNVPHNWDAYDGYRRLRHGNRHGYAYYKKTFSLQPQQTNKRIFLFFEGVGSYATVWLNGKKVGYHAGGRTTFTLDVTDAVRFNGENQLFVRADHPANIQDLPWICGGCSDDRGWSEGSQPMGIFRPVHLVVTSDLRIEPFGVHVWNDTTITESSAQLNVETEIKNYSNRNRSFEITNRLLDKAGVAVSTSSNKQMLAAGATAIIKQLPPVVRRPQLWSVEHPYLYTLVTEIREGGKLLDQVRTPYGIRKISWPVANKNSRQFLLNGKPVFINGTAEYEHLLGGSHAFDEEQIRTRVNAVKATGFNAFRDAHQPHNLRYGAAWDSLGILWWTQLSAHDWYDTPAFRENFKTLLKEWVKERRNSPSIILWGLQNESKLPEDFSRECTELIRQLDPTASSQRLVTTCNGGSGTDWDVPQNWTGTYGGNPATYGEDLKRQVLVGEYGAWRTLDLHTEGAFLQNGPVSEDRFAQLMELKIHLADSVKDSVAGHFHWLLTSHDNPGRVQSGEGFRELDRIGPVNYKGLLTPWEEPTDAFFLYRSNFVSKEKEPMVYIVSHTWPQRWLQPGKKDGITVYSNCDEVELFNDIDGSSLGRKKRGGIGTHFQWDGVNIQYNLLYAVGYVAGKAVAKDTVVLYHLPQAPHFARLYKNAQNITAPQAGYTYLYRVNCGGGDYKDASGATWLADRSLPASKAQTPNAKPQTAFWGSSSWTVDFPEMPAHFASQRATSEPVKGTSDWKLFQSFRYGREKLRYAFPVPNGEYRVELYFAEPWWGRGGGLDATGWRLFDVAVNGNTVLKNLDPWKEAGYSTALKKVVMAKVTGGLLTISFPHVASGQAVISAIAIATLDQNAKPAPGAPALIQNLKTDTEIPWSIGSWANVGDVQFNTGKETFHSLPPVLYAAEWIKTTGVAGTVAGNRKAGFTVAADADVYVAYQFARPSWLTGYDDTKDSLVNSDGTVFRLYKKRFAEGATIPLEMSQSDQYSVFAVPASRMEPAYDLKPVNSYKAAAAKLLGPGVKKGQVDGKDRAIFETASPENGVEWTMNVGVADVYSLTISYNNPMQKNMRGRLQFFAADGTLMKEETVEFTPTRTGKSNYISTTTGSMINAGRYNVRLTTGEADKLSINALDVQ